MCVTLEAHATYHKTLKERPFAAEHLTCITLAGTPINMLSHFMIFLWGTWLCNSPTLWAGHYQIAGEVSVPLLGTRPTRTDSYVLAEIVDNNDHLHITEHTCWVHIASVAGVESAMHPTTFARLPKIDYILYKNTDGYLIGQWHSGWSSADVDLDGSPGVSMLINSPWCRGTMYISSQSQNWAKVKQTQQGLKGRLEVVLQQKTLGATSFCLRMAPLIQPRQLLGAVHFVQVPQGTSCASLLQTAWPADAASIDEAWPGSVESTSLTHGTR